MTEQKRRIRLINDVPAFGLKKGKILEVSDFDVVTDEYIVHPLYGIGTNMRFQKGLNCKEI